MSFRAFRDIRYTQYENVLRSFFWLLSLACRRTISCQLGEIVYYTKMKILHRYILKDILSSFIIGFLFFNFILLIGVIFDLTELIFIKKAALLEVLKLLLFILPSFFNIVIPLSLLFTGLFTFGRLSAEGEIIAFLSSGISLFRIQNTLLVFAFILSGVSLYFSWSVTPWSNYQYRQTYDRIIVAKPTVQIKEGTITDLGGKKLYTRYIDSKTDKMKEIIFYEFIPQGDFLFPQLIIAQEGEFKKEVLNLKEVALYRFGNNYSLVQQGKFDSQNIYLNNQFSPKEREWKRNNELSLSEISQKIKKEKAKENPNPKEIKELSIEFHSRTAVPLATLLFALIAIPLGITMKRKGNSVSMGVSLVIAIGYYVLFLAGKFLARGELLSPYLAMWLPNVLLGIVAIWLTAKSAKI